MANKSKTFEQFIVDLHILLDSYLGREQSVDEAPAEKPAKGKKVAKVEEPAEEESADEAGADVIAASDAVAESWYTTEDGTVLQAVGKKGKKGTTIGWQFKDQDGKVQLIDADTALTPYSEEEPAAEEEVSEEPTAEAIVAGDAEEGKSYSAEDGEVFTATGKKGKAGNTVGFIFLDAEGKKKLLAEDTTLVPVAEGEGVANEEAPEEIEEEAPKAKPAAKGGAAAFKKTAGKK